MEETKDVKKSKIKAETISEFLSDVNVMIKNAKLPEIDIELQRLNIGGEFIDKGENLLTELFSLQALQHKHYGKSQDANESFRDLKKVSMATYNDYRTIAKLLFEDDKIRTESLGLDERRDKSVKGFFKQGEHFYQNVLSNPDTLDRFMTYNISEDLLKKSYAEFKSLADLYANKKSEKVEATKSTKKRDNKLDELRDWVSKFKIVAKIALKEKEFLLEKLGI